MYVVAARGLWRLLRVQNRSEVLIKVGIAEDKIKRRKQLSATTPFHWTYFYARKYDWTIAYERESIWKRVLRRWSIRKSGRGEFFLVPYWLPSALKAMDTKFSTDELEKLAHEALPQIAAAHAQWPLPNTKRSHGAENH